MVFNIKTIATHLLAVLLFDEMLIGPVAYKPNVEKLFKGLLFKSGTVVGMNTWWPETRLNYRTQIFMKMLLKTKSTKEHAATLGFFPVLG